MLLQQAQVPLDSRCCMQDSHSNRSRSTSSVVVSPAKQMRHGLSGALLAAAAAVAATQVARMPVQATGWRKMTSSSSSSSSRKARDLAPLHGQEPDRIEAHLHKQKQLLQGGSQCP